MTNTTNKQIELMLGRKATAKEDDFIQVGVKPSGTSQGYIATKDKLQYLIKKVANPQQANTNDYCAMGAVHELIMAPLYKMLMYGRAPYVASVKTSSAKVVALASEFLPGSFQTVAQYTASPSPSEIGPGYAKLLQAQDAEKLIATMLMLGEYDVNSGNIGIMHEQQDGVDKLVFAKIDHGWSAMQFFTDPEIALQNLRQMFEIYYKHYYDEKKKKHQCEHYLIPINIAKFKEHIAQICLIDQEAISEFLMASWQAFQQLGINLNNLMLREWQDDKFHRYDAYDLPPASVYSNFGGCVYYLVEELALIDLAAIKEAYICVYEEQSKQLKYSYIKNGKVAAEKSIMLDQATVAELKTNRSNKGQLNSVGIKLLQQQPGFRRSDTDLLEHLVQKFTQQLQVMQAIGEYLEVIGAIANDNQQEWDNGAWLQVCVDNPIIWAMKNNRKIADQEPGVWLANRIIDSEKINQVALRAIAADHNGDILLAIIGKLSAIEEPNKRQKLLQLVITCYRQENSQIENIWQQNSDILDGLIPDVVDVVTDSQEVEL